MANEKTVAVKGSTGFRYDDAKKAEILAFYNTQEGRGKVTQTLEKFGISYISLRNWLKNAGKEAKKARKASKKVSTKESTGEAAKRGRKANPSIFILRQLEKLKSQTERNLDNINKAMEKISAK